MDRVAPSVAQFRFERTPGEFEPCTIDVEYRLAGSDVQSMTGAVSESWRKRFACTQRPLATTLSGQIHHQPPTSIAWIPAMAANITIEPLCRSHGWALET